MHRIKQDNLIPRFKTILTLSGASAAILAISLACNSAGAQPEAAAQTVLFEGATPIGSDELGATRGAGTTPSGAVVSGRPGDVAVILWDEIPLPKTGGGSVSSTGSTQTVVNGHSLKTTN